MRSAKNCAVAETIPASRSSARQSASEHGAALDALRSELLAQPIEDDALPEFVGVGLDQRQLLLLVQRPLPDDLLPVAPGQHLVKERRRIAVFIDAEVLEEQRPAPGRVPAIS